MAKVRINFGISEAMRNWIKIQPNVVGIVEESETHCVVEHNMTGPQATAMKTAFLDKLLEVI